MPSSFFLKLEPRSLLEEILSLSESEKIKLYLVGGVLRDIFLRRSNPNPDIDFCLEKHALNFARAVARKIKGGFVVLDKEHGCARVVKKIRNQVYTLDFADFRGPGIEEDLRLRDFSVNSLALPLDAISSPCAPDNFIIDPCQGRKDLRSKIIRLSHKEGFDDDPIRILRAFSFSCLFGFKISPETLRLAKLKRKKLTAMAQERIRDELFKIFSSARGYQSIQELDRHRILELIIPEIEGMRKVKQGPYHHLRVWEHSLETLKNLEAIIKSFSRNHDIAAYLNQEISSRRQRYELMKLAAILHDIAKPKTIKVRKGKLTFYGHERLGAEMTEKVASRLKLSNEEIRLLKQIVFNHLRPGYLVTNETLTPRAKFRFFRDTSSEAVSILLLSLADQRATRGYLKVEKSRKRHEKLARQLVRTYFLKRSQKEAPSFLNGDDLISHFKLEPSILIGKVLRELEESQAIGRIKSKKEALQEAGRLIRIFSKK